MRSGVEVRSRSGSMAGRAKSSRSSIIEFGHHRASGRPAHRGNSAGCGQRPLELTQEPPPRDRLGPEPLEMGSLLLAVDQAEAALAEGRPPGSRTRPWRRRARCRTSTRRRTPARSRPRRARRRAGRRPSSPPSARGRGGGASHVGLDHRLADPGAVLVAPAGRGAGSDHRLERGVEADLEAAGAQRLAQRPADVELGADAARSAGPG